MADVILPWIIREVRENQEILEWNDLIMVNLNVVGNCSEFVTGCQRINLDKFKEAYKLI